jgi:hypothetical protein
MASRMQITLAPETSRRAKRRAAELGISFAEYVRRVVELDLGEPPQTVDPSQIFGLFDTGGSDVAKHKDRYVDEAVRGAGHGV